MRTFFFALAFVLGGCARAACPEQAPARTPNETRAAAPPRAPAHAMARVINASGTAPIEWSSEERQKDIALRTATVSEQRSTHWIHARGAERPHVHERTDMLVFVVSGKVEVHVGVHTVLAERGDVIEVPKGTPHWVKNVHPQGSVAYAVFSPPFDGTDRRFLDTPGTGPEQGAATAPAGATHGDAAPAAQ